MNDIVKVSNQLPMSSSQQVFDLLQHAIDRGIEPDALEKLLALKERMDAAEAKAQYINAMAEFQSQCPPIVKHKSVRGRSGAIIYRYAPLDDIVAQVKPLLVSLGFSWSFNTEPDGKGGATVSCTIRHRGGHQETNSVPVPSTQGNGTNAAQNLGIVVQYGMRYSFIGALGITTADEDTDSRTETVKPISANQAADLEAMITEVGADKEKFLKYMRVESINDIQQSHYDRAIKALEEKRRQQT